MIPGARPKLSQLILGLVESKHLVSAKDVHSLLKERGQAHSLVAIYKEFNKLEAQGIVLKERQQWRLSLTWILSLLGYAQDLYQGFLVSPAARSLLPEMGERKQWKFPTLRQMDALWVQLMFFLFEHSSSRVMYEWVPRLWFPYLSWTRDEEYLKAMLVAGNKIKLIVGGDSFLDRFPTKRWDKRTYEVSHARGPFHNERSRYYTVIDDFVITVKVSRASASALDSLFAEVLRYSDFDAVRFNELVDGRSESALVIERSNEKARKLRRKFEEYF